MQITEHVLLKDYTTLRVGGPARYFATAHDLPELQSLLAHARKEHLPVLILGGGSNILAPDSGWGGLVIKIALRGRTFAEEVEGSVIVTSAAGEVWDEVVAECVSRDIWGLENLSGIPGTVGATPIQNVGAYGTEVKDVISAVEVLEVESGKVRTLLPEECDFSYRSSLFKKEAGRFVILGVSFRLSRKPKPQLHYRDLAEYFAAHHNLPALREIRDAVLAIRARKFPDLRAVGTAGSFFKNPIVDNETLAQLLKRFPDVPHFRVEAGKEKISLAWLLDRACNLKGVIHGAVGAFERQPLVIVNTGGASARDVRAFASFIASCVKEKTNLVIEPEVAVIE